MQQLSAGNKRYGLRIEVHYKKGRALDVYAFLPSDKALDYSELKKELLKRYELTEDGFKRKFRACRPEYGETFCQFTVRLASHLTKRIEMSSTYRTYGGLFDLTIRDQLFHICNKELSLFLMERISSSAQQMATLADQFKEARLTSAVNLTFPAGSKDQRSYPKPTPVSVKRSDTGKKAEYHSTFSESERRFFKCGNPFHIATNCSLQQNKAGNVSSGSTDTVKKRVGNILVMGRSRRLSPYSRVRFEESEQGRAGNRDSCEAKDQSRIDQSPTCGACALFKDSIIDVCAKSNVPLLTSACSSKTYRMPVTEGLLGVILQLRF